MSTIYNNFIHMYINLFLANGLANKKFIHRVISHYNKKRMVENISGDGKTNLKILAKEFKRKKT